MAVLLPNNIAFQEKYHLHGESFFHFPYRTGKVPHLLQTHVRSWPIFSEFQRHHRRSEFQQYTFLRQVGGSLHTGNNVDWSAKKRIGLTPNLHSCLWATIRTFTFCRTAAANICLPSGGKDTPKQYCSPASGMIYRESPVRSYKDNPERPSTRLSHSGVIPSTCF